MTMLRSTRLILMPYTPMLVKNEHVEWLNNKELMQFSEQRHKEHTLKSQLDYVRNEIPNRYLWLIRCSNNDIGSISVYHDLTNNRANLGILIGKPEYRGHGFAAEAWTTVIDYLFESGLHKVEAGCREDNEPMIQLAVTTGMHREAIIGQHFRVGDEYKDMYCYARFAKDGYHSEWKKMWSEPFWKAEKKGKEDATG